MTEGHFYNCFNGPLLLIYNKVLHHLNSIVFRFYRFDVGFNEIKSYVFLSGIFDDKLLMIK